VACFEALLLPAMHTSLDSNNSGYAPMEPPPLYPDSSVLGSTDSMFKPAVSRYRSQGASKLSRSTGMMVVCPCPGPPALHKSMMSRYGNLESGLRNNWASMHDAGNKLGQTRGDAGTELESMLALAKAQADHAQYLKDLEEAERNTVHDWVAHTISQSARLPSMSEPRETRALASTLSSGPTETPWKTGDLRLKRWNVTHRDHVKEPASPITMGDQANTRWEYLFGDSNVAFAPPGTGVAAFSGQVPKTEKASKFSHSSGWHGLMRGDVFQVSTRTADVGPTSSITLAHEYDKRTAHMQSLTPR